MAFYPENSPAGAVQRIALVLFGLGVLAVTYGSLDPRLAVGSQIASPILVHAAAYGFLGLLAPLAFPRTGVALAVGAALAVLGGLIEIAQAFIPGRSGNWLDAAVNLAAVSAGLGAGFLIRRASRRAGDRRDD